MNKKKEKLNIRLKSSEKIKLMKNAEENDLNVSDYVRKLLFHSGKKLFDAEDRVIFLSVKLQEAVNYICEKYKEDKKLEGMMDEIWEHMKN